MLKLDVEDTTLDIENNNPNLSEYEKMFLKHRDLFRDTLKNSSKGVLNRVCGDKNYYIGGHIGNGRISNAKIFVFVRWSNEWYYIPTSEYDRL